jgi:hypothetical protein
VQNSAKRNLGFTRNRVHEVSDYAINLSRQTSPGVDRRARTDRETWPASQGAVRFGCGPRLHSSEDRNTMARSWLFFFSWPSMGRVSL